jgi:O-antigen/teichoic acid export membrane protein
MMIHVYGSLLTASGSFKTFTWIVIASVTSNIIINVSLIPDHGAMACVYAALFSQYLLAILCYVYAVSRTAIPWAARPFLLNFAIAALFGVLFYFLREQEVSMPLVLVVAGVISALFMFVQTKLIKARN